MLTNNPMVDSTSTMEENLKQDFDGQTTFLTNEDRLQQILDAIPQPTALIDHNYKTLMVNKMMKTLLNTDDNELLVKKRIGEMFHCYHDHNSENGCGTSESCQVCGINKSLTISSTKNIQQTETCTLSLVDSNGRFKSFLNLRVTTSPFHFGQQNLMLFTMTDISNDINRRMLERIFFHDVLNKAGNIIGIVDILSAHQNQEGKYSDLFESLKTTSHDLVEEILYQRDVSSAENNELIPKFDTANSFDVIKLTQSQILNSEVALKKEIVFDETSVDLNIWTDKVLLRRVLLNMLKNALEATKTNEKVYMGCNLLPTNHVRFWVKNNSVIPKNIQLQLFNKSFSTKETGRGLGTYSIKLLGEKYLNGSVSFVSNAEKGTVFMIDIPY